MDKLDEIPDLDDMKEVGPILKSLSKAHVMAVRDTLELPRDSNDNIDDVIRRVKIKKVPLPELRRAVRKVVGNYKLAMYTRRFTRGGKCKVRDIDEIADYIETFIESKKYKTTSGRVTFLPDGGIKLVMDTNHPFYTHKYKSRYTDKDGILLGWKLALARRGWKTSSSDIRHKVIFFHPIRSRSRRENEIRKIKDRLRLQLSDMAFIFKRKRTGGWDVSKYE